jgi:hypothetical protein
MPQTSKPSSPLPQPKHEAFAIAIVEGAKLLDAYERAGFTGRSHANAWQLRHKPHVKARVEFLLNERVKASAHKFAKRKKTSGDLLDRAMKELEAIAFVDIREVIDWRRQAVTNGDGEVTEITEDVQVRDAASIPASAAKAIKGVFLKSGKLRVEMHDKRQALVDIVKALSGSDAALQGNTINVQQINVGAHDALEAAKRVSFLLAAARSREPAVKTIDVTPDKPKE